MKSFSKSDRSTVKRIPSRGHYDKETIYEILDDGMICHVSFVVEGQPFVIPVIYGRSGDKLFIHGSVKSRMLTTLDKDMPISLCVTHVDGLVLARSAFHHSMNYRSAIIFGKARLVPSEEKAAALEIITNHVLKGRWEECRPVLQQEMDATTVLEINIDEASAKIRAEGVNDSKSDLDQDVWAGIVPVEQHFGKPEPDEFVKAGIEVPKSVLKLVKK